MVLNPALYNALRYLFGEVRVSGEDVKRLENREPGEKHSTVLERGEHYNVSCPLCGDTRQRMSVSYMWLAKEFMTNNRQTHLVHCYNEECEGLRKSEFYGKVLEAIEKYELGILPSTDIVSSRTVSRQRQKIELPNGCVPLSSLPQSHVAHQFLNTKYSIPSSYIAKAYEVQWTETFDERYPAARNRIIFPIRNMDGELVAWQGRSLSVKDKLKWFLPAGFMKTFYNGYRVSPVNTPIIAEGITSAIACGPNGIAIFGKQLNSLRASEMGEKWGSVVIATDPETFTPDFRKGGKGRVFADEMHSLLSKYIGDVRSIRWPDDVLELARRHNLGEEGITIPDAADLGVVKMKLLLDGVLT